jgi:hypothetical protein
MAEDLLCRLVAPTKCGGTFATALSAAPAAFHAFGKRCQEAGIGRMLLLHIQPHQSRRPQLARSLCHPSSVVTRTAPSTDGTPLHRVPLIESPLMEFPFAESPLMESPLMESPLMEFLVAESPLMESPLMESPLMESPILPSLNLRKN